MRAPRSSALYKAGPGGWQLLRRSKPRHLRTGAAAISSTTRRPSSSATAGRRPDGAAGFAGSGRRRPSAAKLFGRCPVRRRDPGPAERACRPRRRRRRRASRRGGRAAGRRRRGSGRRGRSRRCAGRRPARARSAASRRGEGPAEDRRRAVVDAVVGEDADVDAGGGDRVLLGDRKGSCQSRVIRARAPSVERLDRTLSGSPCSRRQLKASGRPFASRVSSAERVIVRVAGLRAPDPRDAPGVSKSCSERPSPKIVDALGAEVLLDHARCGPRPGSRRA